MYRILNIGTCKISFCIVFLTCFRRRKKRNKKLDIEPEGDTTDGNTPRSQRPPRARKASGARKLAPTFDLADEETPKKASSKTRSKSRDRDISGAESRDDETPRRRTRKKRDSSTERRLDDGESRDEETPRRRRSIRTGSRENLISAGEDEGMMEKKSGKRKQKSHHVERTV